MTTNTLGVVVQLDDDAYIGGTQTFPGLRSYTIDLLGLAGDGTGVSLSCTELALRRLQAVIDGQLLLAEQERRRQADLQSWDRRRPPLRAVSPDNVRDLDTGAVGSARRHPSYAGDLA